MKQRDALDCVTQMGERGGGGGENLPPTQAKLPREGHAVAAQRLNNFLCKLVIRVSDRLLLSSLVALVRVFSLLFLFLCWANVAVLGWVVGGRGRQLLFGLCQAACGCVRRMACGGCRGCLLDATWTGEALRVGRAEAGIPAAATGKHAATVGPAPGRLLAAMAMVSK